MSPTWREILKKNVKNGNTGNSKKCAFENRQSVSWYNFNFILKVRNFSSRDKINMASSLTPLLYWLTMIITLSRAKNTTNNLTPCSLAHLLSNDILIYGDNHPTLGEIYKHIMMTVFSLIFTSLYLSQVIPLSYNSANSNVEIITMDNLIYVPTRLEIRDSLVSNVSLTFVIGPGIAHTNWT